MQNCIFLYIYMKLDQSEHLNISTLELLCGRKDTCGPTPLLHIVFDRVRFVCQILSDVLQTISLWRDSAGPGGDESGCHKINQTKYDRHWTDIVSNVSLMWVTSWVGEGWTLLGPLCCFLEQMPWQSNPSCGPRTEVRRRFPWFLFDKGGCPFRTADKFTVRQDAPWRCN